MKRQKTYLLLACIILSIFGCSDKNLGKRSDILKSNTGLFARIYSDTVYKITDGVYGAEIAYLSAKGELMKIFILEADLKKSSVEMKVSMPNGENTYGMQQMTKQAEAMDKDGYTVWTGINADFYNMKTGVPRGIVYRNGEKLKDSYDKGDRGFFAITKDKKALVATDDEYPDISNKLEFQEAVGGGALLLKDGKVLSQANKTIEPRTCVGISADSTKVYMLAVDGRNKAYSNGMTLEELAVCLKELGADTALNLDGGGSTTYFIRNTSDSAEDKFEIRNKPSDTSGERPVANGIVIMSRNK